jgi:hypothetical protein
MMWNKDKAATIQFFYFTPAKIIEVCRMQTSIRHLIGLRNLLNSVLEQAGEDGPGPDRPVSKSISSNKKSQG